MSITEQQKANALFKKFQGKADTSPYLEFYEEPLKSSFIVTPENFWIDTEYIPNTAPHLQDREEYVITFDNGFKLPVLRKYNNLYLDPVPGSIASFFHPELADALPHDYKDGSYHYILRDSADQELAYGLNAWVVDFQAGVLTFYQGLPEDVELPLSISFYRYIGRKTFEGVIKTDGTTPMVNEYSPDRDQDVTTKKYVDDGLAEIKNVVDRLVPEPPPNLSARSLVMQLYKAYAVGTGEEHDCTLFSTPEIHVDGPFYNGDAGELKAFIDDEEVAAYTLSAADDTGAHGAIHITADEDMYAGENQRKDFHKQLRGYIQPEEALSPGKHKAKLQHSLTGATPEKEFWVDNPSTNASIGLTSGSNFAEDIDDSDIQYVSGVPTLSTSSTLPISLKIEHVAGTHYSNMIAKLTSSHLQNEDFEVEDVITDANAAIFLTKTLRVRPNVYTENIQIQLNALNSAREPFEGSIITRPVRIDTVSDETYRVTSGTGDYPSDHFGLPYPSDEDLSENEELQMINGMFRWPSGNYVSNLPSGPNYNDIPRIGTRWATFKSIELQYADGFTLHINGAQNWSASSETSKTSAVSIFAKVVNNTSPKESTGWINCNEPYGGVGKPSRDGDGAMIVPSSTATIKRVSFGPVTRSGQLYIRIGLKDTSKRFSTITVTPN